MNSNQPPLLPSKLKQRRRALRLIGGIAGLIVVLGLCVYAGIQAIVASGIIKGPDAMFGDQHLKTAVAIIELHKVRFGSYPDSLRDLKFTGQWDQIALQSVDYYTNSNRTAYYVEVRRGWIGKPKLEVPVDFWTGTGYSKELRPKK